MAVLGAGPIGLEAALRARQTGLAVTVFERAPQVAAHVRKWGHVRLFSPFGMNVTAQGLAALRAAEPGRRLPPDDAQLTGYEHLEVYWQPLARLLEDCLRLKTEVVYVGKTGLLKEDSPADPRRGAVPFCLLVRHDGKEERLEADIVLDCTGTYGEHRWLGDGGIPALGEQIAASSIEYGLADILGDREHHYAGKSTLVVGSGYSAATTVCNLVTLAERHPATTILWLTRGANAQPIQRFANDVLVERDRLAVRANALATSGANSVQFYNQTRIETVEPLARSEGFRVHARFAGQPRTFEVERIIANVGYCPDNCLYRELQVHECYASQGPINLAAVLFEHSARGRTIAAAATHILKNPEPNFFILGAKSYGRTFTFRLQSGFDQIRDVFALIG